MKLGHVLDHFSEPPLNFRPTYKFDHNSDEYDTSKKKRLPAWTDRILYVDRGVSCIAYDSDFSLRSSDHRPVFATFVCQVDIPDRVSWNTGALSTGHQTQSRATNADSDGDLSRGGWDDEKPTGGVGKQVSGVRTITDANASKSAPVFKAESQVCILM
jgi:hypothetical protein